MKRLTHFMVIGIALAAAVSAAPLQDLADFRTRYFGSSLELTSDQEEDIRDILGSQLITLDRKLKDGFKDRQSMDEIYRTINEETVELIARHLNERQHAAFTARKIMILPRPLILFLNELLSLTVDQASQIELAIVKSGLSPDALLHVQEKKESAERKDIERRMERLFKEVEKALTEEQNILLKKFLKDLDEEIRGPVESRKKGKD